MREGDTVILKCIVDANPVFDGWIQWLYSPNRGDQTSLGDPEEIFKNGTLTLTNISWDQAGWYECVGGTYWLSSKGKPSYVSGQIDVVVHCK